MRHFMNMCYACMSATALKNVRLWRNWQTRTVEGRMGNRAGSNPVSRTIFFKTTCLDRSA